MTRLMCPVWPCVDICEEELLREHLQVRHQRSVKKNGIDRLMQQARESAWLVKENEERAKGAAYCGHILDALASINREKA